MPSKAHHNTMQQSSHSKDHRHHHRSNRSSSSGLPSHNGNNQFQNDNSFQRSSSPPSPISIHYSAYFIDRIDLDDYTEHTLKQTVDNVVSGIKTKGLKVKLIFPDEGLIVDNLIDPNQSWMYKATELLYFWRDPFYINIIVSITSNRSRPSATGPYSASIFRLRGDGLVQVFFQRAQQFFAQFSAPPPPVSTSSNNNNKILIEKSTTVDNLTTNDNQKKKSSKHNTMTNKQTASKSARSLQTTPVRQGARTEFDPARTKTKTRNSIFNLYNNRTNSDTTLLNEPRAKSSKRRHNNNNNNNTNYEGDNKITSISVHLSGEHVAELMRELKELRNEIASLKLEARFTPVRSTSTSPMTLCPENTLHSTNLSTSLPALTSQSGTESERQIGLSLINPRQQLNEILITNKRKNDQPSTLVNKRTSSTSSNNNNNNESDKEEPQLVNFADANTAMDALHPSQNGDGNQQTVFPLRPRPIKTTYTNGFSQLNNPAFSLTSNNNNNQLKPTSNEDDASSIVIPVSKSSLPVKTGEVVSFRTALDNTMASPDHTYENIPNSSQTDLNKTNSDLRMFNENDQQLKSDIYVNTIVDPNADFQQTPESQKGIVLINSQESTQTTTMTSLSSQTIDPSQLSPRPQTALFANRLTNPVFSVDRQLLANTIANQFDLHLNSPYLQKLIENQHLFVSQKRTYANMIWQITADEENALCSSPVRTIPSITDTLRVDSNSSTVKSILKQQKHRAVSKKQRITWDSRVE
ncbi:unnamed protein product [Adineta steineri]|uniref:Uncharacterized protein n=1 Tax=Adineta steineri TaxID=433720 RepID=A0A818I4T1_9BILA|nr:unnamed protein product [Adineta steineri]CAF3517536.1 unnamed protein product [Adineta steineri]